MKTILATHDGDDTVFPNSPHELPFDEIDSSCDGMDFPVVEGVVEDQTGELAIPESARCQGRGLSIVAVELIIMECQGGFALHLGNRGDQPIEGAVLELRTYIRGFNGAEDMIGDPSTRDLPIIDPGQIVRFVAGGSGQYLLRLLDTAPQGDCPAWNMEGEVSAPTVPCW